jgi:hypothetical protein
MRKMIDMAKEAGMTGLESGGLFDNFLIFEALVRADERESIKTICKAEQTDDSADLWNVCCTHLINKINERNNI